jgi:hypothetical protein
LAARNKEVLLACGLARAIPDIASRNPDAITLENSGISVGIRFAGGAITGVIERRRLKAARASASRPRCA